MRNAKTVMSLLTAGTVMCSFAAEEAKPAAKPAEAPKPAAKPAEPEIWAKLPDVVAQIGDKKITKQEVLKTLLAQMPDGKIPPMLIGQLDNAAPGIIKGIVDQQLLEAAAEKAGFKPSKEQVQKALKAQWEKVSKEDRERYAQMLQVQNKTVEQSQEEMASNPEIQKQVALDEFLRTKIAEPTVTEAEMRKYYEENKQKEFSTPADQPGMFRASHILIMADDKADDAAKKAALDQINAISAELKKDPAKFEALAREKSSCPSKANGGSLGAFSDKDMVPEFQKALEGLKEGEISAPVKTQFGYHIIRRDKLQGEKFESFDSVKETVSNILKRQKQMQAFMDYMAQLEKDNGVKFFVTMPELK
jgi:ppiC-type peptidyl-prolyl cis-trans isomerase